jgi:hypothetical protein
VVALSLSFELLEFLFDSLDFVDLDLNLDFFFTPFFFFFFFFFFFLSALRPGEAPSSLRGVAGSDRRARTRPGRSGLGGGAPVGVCRRNSS